MPLSRRAFAQLLGVGAAAAAVPQLLTAAGAKSGGAVVRLNANENPYGPSPAAIAAMRNAFGESARYPDEEAEALADVIANLHGVSRDEVILGDGSSEILKLVAAAYAGPSKKVVTALPTFEALGFYGRAAGADVVEVPLDAQYAHDLDKMAAQNAAVVYICNPNNPTASITPKAALAKFIHDAPATTMILVDEAYHHYVASADYESVIPLTRSHPNLVVARTFSKIYGMAGLRAGYGIANRDVIKALKRVEAWDSMNLMALVAARASLADTEHVARGKMRNATAKQELIARLAENGYEIIPSEANFVMVDLRRDVKPVIAAMRDRGVRVGRLFPAMPHHLRVTIGTPAEMARFIEVFREVMA